MSLTLNDKTLPVFTLFPSLSSSLVVLHNFLLQHSFNLRMLFCSYHHKTLLRYNDFLEWKYNLISDFLIKPTGPYYLICINILKAFFVNLRVKISINTWLKEQIKKFQQIDTLTNDVIFNVNGINWIKLVPSLYIPCKIFFCEKSHIFFTFCQ